MIVKLIFTITLFISGLLAFKQISLTGCGVSKGCLRPANCPPEKICDYLATWKSVSGDYVEFELVGDVKSRDGFIYMRFSDDKIEGNDGLVGCYMDRSTGNVVVKTGFIDNFGENQYYNSEPEVIVTSGDGLGGMISSRNILQCRFRRLMNPENAETLKDLSPDKNYYIGVYRGSERGSKGFGSPFIGGSAFSNEAKSVSSPLYGSYTDENKKGINLAKAHGMLMVLAWVFCASVGTLISRYYKQMMPNKSILNEPLWFQAHRILMGISVGLTILSIILIAIYCRGYSQVKSWPHYVHPILGFIVLALALINPIVTLFRCQPYDKKRLWHNWTHFIIGIVCFCLSFIQMFLGLRMTGAGLLLSVKDEPISLLIFFVIFQFCCEIILEIHGCIYQRRNDTKMEIYEENLAQSKNDERLMKSRGLYNYPKPEPSGRVFKYFMLGLHITVASIVTVILMIMIAVY